MTENIVYEVWFNDLKFCVCGNPSGMVALFRDALQIMKDRSDLSASGISAPYEGSVWQRKTNELDNLLDGAGGMYRLLVMYVLDSADLTEHGGNVGGSWLTDRGEEFLSALRGKSEQEIDLLLEGYEEIED